MTVGSPSPASTSGPVRMPLKNNASDTPIATMTAGILFQMKSASAARMTANTMVESLTSTSLR